MGDANVRQRLDPAQKRAVAEIERLPVSRRSWLEVGNEKCPTSDEWACAIAGAIAINTR
jgi:hypothetical protein